MPVLFILARRPAGADPSRWELRSNAEQAQAQTMNPKAVLLRVEGAVEIETLLLEIILEKKHLWLE